MAANRWGHTNDQDHDGHKGGSISQAEADRRSGEGRSNDLPRSDVAPDPEKGDTIMARSPKTTTAPAQPWANKDGGAAPASDQPAATAPATDENAADSASAASGNGGGANSGATAESGPAVQTPDAVITSTDQVPSSDVDEIQGDDEDVDIHDTAGQAEALAENDIAKTGTKELPSFVRDQVSPSGTDIALEADRSDKPTLERSAYPSLGERLYAMLGKASPELQQEFEDRMADLAETVINELRANDVSREFNDRVIDGTTHYGPGVRSKAAQEAALDRGTGVTGAELNRRARRAAERLAAQTAKGR